MIRLLCNNSISKLYVSHTKIDVCVNIEIVIMNMIKLILINVQNLSFNRHQQSFSISMHLIRYIKLQSIHFIIKNINK